MKRIKLGMLLVLMVVLVGCAPGSGQPTPTLYIMPTLPPAPTATIVPTLDPAGDPDAPPTYTFAGTGADQIDTYSARLTLEFKGTNPVTSQLATLTTDTMFSSRHDPPSKLLDTTFDAVSVDTSALGLGPSPQGEFKVLLAGNTAYVTQGVGTDGEACVSTPAAQAADLFTGLSNYDDLLGTAVPPLQRVEPNELVNGLESRHYHVEGFSAGQFTSASLDVWVARNGGFATRIILTGDGTFPNLGAGHLTTTYEITSTQQTVDYSPPGDCTPLNG